MFINYLDKYENEVLYEHVDVDSCINKMILSCNEILSVHIHN